MKILNLYAGIGGNRKLWGSDHEIIAIENNKEIAKIYQDFFPKDEIVIADAHDYLLKHFKEFDFIWSSPPCQTHSQIRFNLGVRNRGTKPIYPDMKLYQEVVLLEHHFKGKYVVENTIAYYKPLFSPQEAGKHWFWANFYIHKYDIGDRDHRKGTIETLQQRKQLDISKYDIKNKRQILRNCVEPELGLHIFKCAFRENKKLF